ncbi:MAG: DUF4129 domain-containing protein [Sphingomonadales bacterium]
MATAAGAGAEAVSDQRLAEVHRALLADRSIQFDLPGIAPPPKPPEWLKPLIEFLQWLSPAFPYIFWGVVAVVVLTILYLILSNVVGFEWPWQRNRRSATVEDDSWRPEEAAARALLADAEALAAEGRYAEAARLLLHRSIEDIAGRLPRLLQPSLTARDIASADQLPRAARPAFSAIANVVEVSAFGNRSVTADAWRDCREAYARFALPATWTRTPQHG